MEVRHHDIEHLVLPFQVAVLGLLLGEEASQLLELFAGLQGGRPGRPGKGGSLRLVAGLADLGKLQPQALSFSAGHCLSLGNLLQPRHQLPHLAVCRLSSRRGCDKSLGDFLDGRSLAVGRGGKLSAQRALDIFELLAQAFPLLLQALGLALGLGARGAQLLHPGRRRCLCHQGLEGLAASKFQLLTQAADLVAGGLGSPLEGCETALEHGLVDFLIHPSFKALLLQMAT
mmetsp:Transcript_26459/g.58165  ORF Transcript_26459/g.58165 Transcript_26459/m.58165 type:complete len:230 (-) Transcript_26459:1297-1986(-)